MTSFPSVVLGQVLLPPRPRRLLAFLRHRRRLRLLQPQGPEGPGPRGRPPAHEGTPASPQGPSNPARHDRLRPLLLQEGRQPPCQHLVE